MQESSNELKKILPSFGKISKQWGLGEPTGKVWGFLLFKSIPVSQREIEEGVGYSRGMVSRSLTNLKELNLIFIVKKKNEFYYSTNSSLIAGFTKIIQNFVMMNVQPVITTLTIDLKKIKDKKTKKELSRLIKEFKKLNWGILIFSKSIEHPLLTRGKSWVKISKDYILGDIKND